MRDDSEAGMVPTNEKRLDMDSKQLLEAQYTNRQERATHSISINGRLWHDKTYGNTYWSSRTEIDGEHVLTLAGPRYGYGEHYLHETLRSLFDAGVIPSNELYELRELGWAVYTSAVYGLKREMFKVHA